MSTLQAKYPYYLNNKAVFANEALEVTDKYAGKLPRVAHWPTPRR